MATRQMRLGLICQNRISRRTMRRGTRCARRLLPFNRHIKHPQILFQHTARARLSISHKCVVLDQRRHRPGSSPCCAQERRQERRCSCMERGGAGFIRRRGRRSRAASSQHLGSGSNVGACAAAPLIRLLISPRVVAAILPLKDG